MILAKTRSPDRSVSRCSAVYPCDVAVGFPAGLPVAFRRLLWFFSCILSLPSFPVVSGVNCPPEPDSTVQCGGTRFPYGTP